MAVGWVGPMLPLRHGAKRPARCPSLSARPSALSVLFPRRVRNFWLRGVVSGWNISEIRSAVGDAIARASFR
eukprot:3214495-Pleurochrysis_carterae.AAC.1